MPRKPVDGGDTGAWGGILNQFVEVEHHHNSGSPSDPKNGRLKVKDGWYSKASPNIPMADLDAGIQSQLNDQNGLPANSVTTAMLVDGAVTGAKLSDDGLADAKFDPAVVATIQSAIQTINTKPGPSVDLRLNDLASPTTNLSWNNRLLSTLAAPTLVQDGATKAYIDATVTMSGWQAGGNGSVNRIVFNVKDYGAKGDGATDDLAAINAAMAASGGGRGKTIYFPPGHYRFSGEILMLGTDVAVVGSGRGATILQPLSDFGPGKYLLRGGGSKGRRLVFRAFTALGPNTTAGAPGVSPCNMNGVQLPGGGCLADSIEARHFRSGIEMSADHSLITNSAAHKNYFNFYFGFEINQEADQYIGGCDFSDCYMASIGIRGSNTMGGVTVVASRLGKGPYCIYKEDSSLRPLPPTVSVRTTGGAGAPFDVGGTFYYAISPVFGSTNEAIVSTSATAVVPAGGSVQISWSPVAGAIGYSLFRGNPSQLINGGNAPRTYWSLAANQTSIIDTGPNATTRVPVYGNNLSVSGCTFVGLICDSYDHGFLYSENMDMVTGNSFINCRVLQPFAAATVNGHAQKAAFRGTNITSNFFYNSDGLLVAGSDSDGVVMDNGGSNNVAHVGQFVDQGKPVMPSVAGNSINYNTFQGARARKVFLYSGTINAGDVLGSTLSLSRMWRYPAGGSTPVHGISAQTLPTNNVLIMWYEGIVPVNTVDASLNAPGLWVKPSPSTAGLIVKALSYNDGQVIGYTTAPAAGGKVNVRLINL